MRTTALGRLTAARPLRRGMALAQAQVKPAGADPGPAGAGSSPQAALSRAMLETVQREWPAEPDKPGRSLREHLAARYATGAERPAMGAPERSDALTEISALKELAQNKWAKAFPPAADGGVHGSARERFRLLSTDAQRQVPGLRARHFFVYWARRMLGVDRAK